MTKSLYYIECTCIRDCKFPNVEYHIGDIIYFNPKAASNETYVYYDYINKCHTDWYEKNHIKYGGKIYNDNNEYFSKVIRSITRDYTSIWDAVSHNHQINVCGPHEIKNYVCHECGNHFSDDENVVYIENEDIYVCRNCLDTNFFQCSGCDEYHRYEGDSYEVYYGSDPWSYDLICDSCLTAGLDDGDIYYDTVAERYYRGCDYIYVNNSSEEEEVVSPYTLERMINNGEVFRHSDGDYYTYEENDENNNEVLVPEGDA